MIFPRRAISAPCLVLPLIFCIFDTQCHGFIQKHNLLVRPPSSRILLHSFIATTGGNNDNNNDEDHRFRRQAIMDRNDARTCVKSFLTQRSIQSFIFLLEECRDPHSGKWIEDFLELPSLHSFHGTGAFNFDRFPTWDSVLLEMMRQPKGIIFS